MQSAATPSRVAPGLDSRAARRQTIGTMLILIGILFALAGTGLAASAYLRAVDAPDAEGRVMASLLGTQAPLQFLIGTGAAVAGAVALFFGLVLRSVGDVPLLIPHEGRATPPRHTTRPDPARERRVRWTVMGAFVALFTIAILSAVALSPESLLTGPGDRDADGGSSLLYRDMWQGEAADSPTAHLQDALTSQAQHTWSAPVEAARAVVNVSWAPVGPASEVLRVFVQAEQGDTWRTIGSAEGRSALVVDVPLEGGERIRVVVERTQPADEEQPFVVQLGFWSE